MRNTLLLTAMLLMLACSLALAQVERDPASRHSSGSTAAPFIGGQGQRAQQPPQDVDPQALLNVACRAAGRLAATTVQGQAARIPQLQASAPVRDGFMAAALAPSEPARTTLPEPESSAKPRTATPDSELPAPPEPVQPKQLHTRPAARAAGAQHERGADAVRASEAYEYKVNPPAPDPMPETRQPEPAPEASGEAESTGTEAALRETGHKPEEELIVETNESLDELVALAREKSEELDTIEPTGETVAQPTSRPNRLQRATDESADSPAPANGNTDKNNANQPVVITEEVVVDDHVADAADGGNSAGGSAGHAAGKSADSSDDANGDAASTSDGSNVAEVPAAANKPARDKDSTEGNSTAADSSTDSFMQPFTPQSDDNANLKPDAANTRQSDGNENTAVGEEEVEAGAAGLEDGSAHQSVDGLLGRDGTRGGVFRSQPPAAEDTAPADEASAAQPRETTAREVEPAQPAAEPAALAGTGPLKLRDATAPAPRAAFPPLTPPADGAAADSTLLPAPAEGASASLSAPPLRRPPLAIRLGDGEPQMPPYDVSAKLRVIERGNPRLKQVALTFDDGPHPEYTSQLLAVLDYYDVEATFFCVGVQAQKYPHWIKMMHQQGHEIASQTYDHFRLPKLPRAEKEYQIDEYQRLVENLVGVTPRFMRPPGGQQDPETEALLADRRMVMALWDVAINDTREGRLKQELLSVSLRHVRPGSVLLAHDGVQATIDMLPELIETLRAEGYEFVTMSQLAAGL